MGSTKERMFMEWDRLKKECSWNIKSIFLNLVRNAKKLYFRKHVENNKDMLFHQFGARMNSHRRNSTKVLRRSRKDTAPGPDRIQY